MALSNILTTNDLNIFSNSLVENQLTTAQRLALPQVNGTMVYDSQFFNSGVTGSFMFYQGGQWDSLLGATGSIVPNFDQGTFPLTLSGPWASPITNTIRFTQIGNVVTLGIPAYQTSTTSISSITSGPGGIPANLSPSSDIEVGFEIFVVDNGNRQLNPGWLQIVSNGNFTVYKNNTLAGFTGPSSGGAGFNPISITYSL